MTTNQKLIQACSGLGLNLLEISKFVRISDRPRIACWGYDLGEKECFIYVNPRVLNFPVEHLQLVLKHEIFHYAGYRTVECVRDFDRANVAFDVVINKILTIAHDRQMKELCRKIYPEATKQSVLCLARPDVNPMELKRYKRQWLSIWNNQEIPSPASIYYQIAEPTARIGNPFGVNAVIACITFRRCPELATSDGLNRLAGHVIDKLAEEVGDGFSSCNVSSMFRQLFVKKKPFDSGSVEAFIAQIESREKLEETCGKIVSALDNRSMRQLYPYELSRLGIIYVACGVSTKLPIFWNKTPESRKSRLAVYVDTSPSMECYQEKEVFLIERLKSYFPTRIFCFADGVKETSLEDFADGTYEEGCGTSFDAVIEHLIDSESEAGVIFTDGFSDVNSANHERFKQSRKRLFTVYFCDDEGIGSELDGLSEQRMTVSAN